MLFMHACFSPEYTHIHTHTQTPKCAVVSAENPEQLKADKLFTWVCVFCFFSFFSIPLFIHPDCISLCRDIVHPRCAIGLSYQYAACTSSLNMAKAFGSHQAPLIRWETKASLFKECIKLKDSVRHHWDRIKDEEEQELICLGNEYKNKWDMKREVGGGWNSFLLKVQKHK